MDLQLFLKDPMLLRNQCYIDGHWAAAESGLTFEVSDPATGSEIASVPLMGASEARQKRS